MRERKYVKIKVDMFEDTKFKIIDSMEGRDTIYYIWTRILALCGKINNDEGFLFVSKEIPYTIEILSLEFNRTEEQVKNAIDVFIRLNMMSKDDRIGAYKLCNWSKHQGIRKNKKEKIEVDSTEQKEIKMDIIESDSAQSNKDLEKNQINKENDSQSNIKEISLINKINNKKNSKDKTVDFENVINEACIDTVKVKPKNRRKSKKQTNEILVFEEDAQELDVCGVDVPLASQGEVVNSFYFT